MAHLQQTEHDPWDGPPKDGLYDPQLEKEACGVGFIVAIDGNRSNKVHIIIIIFILIIVKITMILCDIILM